MYAGLYAQRLVGTKMVQQVEEGSESCTLYFALKMMMIQTLASPAKAAASTKMLHMTAEASNDAAQEQLVHLKEMHSQVYIHMYNLLYMNIAYIVNIMYLYNCVHDYIWMHSLRT
jgi:hypothetical protein